MSCPGNKIVYDSELNAYICEETGEVIDEKPIVMEHFGRGDFEDAQNLPIISDGIMHNYGIGTSVSRINYGEAMAITLHHILWDMVKRLGLPKYVHEDSAKTIKKLIRDRFTVGRKREDLVAAVLYASIRRYGLPITFEELCKELGVNKKRTWRFYMSLAKELGLRQRFVPLQDYIVQAVSKMGIDYKEIQPIVESIVARIPLDMRYRKPNVLSQAVVLLALLIKRGMEGGGK